MTMSSTYTAVTTHSGEWWVGWIDEVPAVNCQERSYEALMESLRTTLVEVLTADPEAGASASSKGNQEEPVAL
jgi:hypothetical protein